MINYKNIHVALIGYHKSVPQYRLMLDIYRENFSFGKDLWITSSYEGDDKLFISGLGENAYIKTDVSGYAFGALEQINQSLGFSIAIGREIVVLHNFDVLFFSEAGFNRAIQEFVDSDKQFSAAIDGNGLPATDCMIFNRSFLVKLRKEGLFPFKTEHAKYRENLEIAERYKKTELEFDNVEEWIFNSLSLYAEKLRLSLDIVPIKPLTVNEPNENMYMWENQDDGYKKFLLDNLWHPMSRTDLPRLRWSDELTLGHLHDLEEIKQLILKNNLLKGNAIKYFLGI